MKILIVRNFPSYMSVVNCSYNVQELGLAKALVRAGHECDILFWTNGREEDVRVGFDGGLSVTVYYRKGISFLKNVIFTGCDGLFARYDVLQAAEYNQIQSWIFAKKYRGKTVIYHGPYYSPVAKRYNAACAVFDLFFLRRYVKLDTGFIAKSRLAGELLESKGIRRERIAVAGVGMDVQLLTDGSSVCGLPLYKEMCADGSGLKMLYVGRMDDKRDVPFILDVFAEVKKKRPGVKLYMVGNGEPKYLRKIWRRAARLGVKDDVVWEKKVEQKYMSLLYNQADYFLFPSRYEIYGMVLMEAMYFGDIVLSTDNGGSCMLINNGENGYIIDSRDAREWADTILSLSEDPNGAERIAAAAVRTVTEEFSWDTLAPVFIGQYEILLNEGSQNGNFPKSDK